MLHLNELNTPDSRLKASLSTLEDALVSFSEITHIPVTFYSPEGDLLWEHNEDIKICKANSSYCHPESHCRRNLKSAMNIALGLGEEYIFVCDSGLTNLAYALTGNDRVVGYFIAGPIAMGTNRKNSLKHFYEKVSTEVMNLPELMHITGDIKLFSPKETTHIMTLYRSLFKLPGIGGLSSINRQKAQEQTNVVTKIIEMKKSDIEIDYPVKSETELLISVSSGDSEKSIRSLSKYVEDLMVFENGDLSLIKIRLLSLFAQLQNSSDSAAEYENFSALEQLNNASTFKELMAAASSFAESAASGIASETYSGNSEVVSKAIVFIRSNYMNSISLSEIAESAHVNSSYLSTLFKKEMGTTVTSYVLDIRMENATRQLETTNLSITEIAWSCGFESPSYFTKLFKERFGITPREYRK